MALVVLDASAILALRTATDAHHTNAVAAFANHASDRLVLPASAYSEVLVEPLARGGRAVERAKRMILDVAIGVEPIGSEIAERAAEIRARHRLRLPDAVVLATGDVLDADVVLTADAGWQRVSSRARVI